MKLLAIFFVHTARFVSDLVGNLEDMFSHDTAYYNLKILKCASKQQSFLTSEPVFLEDGNSKRDTYSGFKGSNTTLQMGRRMKNYAVGENVKSDGDDR